MHLRKKKTLLDQASDYVESVRPQVEAAVSQALDAVEEFVESTAKPAIADAKEKTSAVTSDAKTKAAPLAAAGAALAVERAHTAKQTAGEKVARLKGEKPKESHKLRNLLVLLGLAGIAAFVARKLTSGGGDTWQSTYTPAPAPAPTDVTDDVGGAGPDEALSDTVEAPHPTSTPDSPAEVIDVEPPRDNGPRP